MYQLHQIAINNYNDCANLLMQKYNLPAPQNSDELIEAVNYATQTFGDNFVNDVVSIQAQRNAIAQSEIAYKNQLDTSNKEQLKEELVRLNLKLNLAMDIPTREYILDKIAYTQKLIIAKTENSTNNLTTNNPQLATNNLLLMGLAAFVLMFIGSKIFKQ